MKIIRTLLRSLYIILNFIEMTIFGILTVPLYVLSLIAKIPYVIFYHARKHRILLGFGFLLVTIFFLLIFKPYLSNSCSIRFSGHAFTYLPFIIAAAIDAETKLPCNKLFG